MSLIVCEGLDGAGKTSLLERIIEKNKDYVYSKGVCSKTWVGKLARRFPCTLTLMLDLAYQTHSFINPNLRKGKTVLQDRYDISIKSHPKYKSWYNRIAYYLVKPLLRKPDYLVYLTVSKDERIERLKSLQYNKYHEELINNPETIFARDSVYDACYASFKGRKVKVDTTGKSIEEAIDELILCFD